MSSTEAALDRHLNEVDQNEEEFNVEFLQAEIDELQQENSHLGRENVKLSNAYLDLHKWASQYIHNYCNGDLATPTIPDFIN